MSEKKEALKKMSDLHVVFASLIGASYDLGVMNQAIMIPAMKATAQRLILNQIQKNLLPKLNSEDSLVTNTQQAIDFLNERLQFANHYEIVSSEENPI